jgi:hypothetical protein
MPCDWYDKNILKGWCRCIVGFADEFTSLLPLQITWYLATECCMMISASVSVGRSDFLAAVT